MGYSDFEDALRTFDATPVPGEEETTTDLASVPGPLRWFLGSYGVHTPAVLIHDRLIPTPPDMVGRITEQQADRYMRFMLKALGVRWFGNAGSCGPAWRSAPVLHRVDGSGSVSSSGSLLLSPVSPPSSSPRSQAIRSGSLPPSSPRLGSPFCGIGSSERA